MDDMGTILNLNPCSIWDLRVEHRELLRELESATKAAIHAGEVIIALRLVEISGSVASRMLEAIADG